jgi:hypothetical protein
VTIKYADGTSYERNFDDEYMRHRINDYFPGMYGPRVTRKP